MNLLEARKQANFTQQDIADLAGTTLATINLIEVGKTYPSRDTRNRIEIAVGDVDWVGTRLKHLKAENGSSEVATAILDYIHNSTEADRQMKIRFLKEIIKRL